MGHQKAEGKQEVGQTQRSTPVCPALPLLNQDHARLDRRSVNAENLALVLGATTSKQKRLLLAVGSAVQAQASPMLNVEF